MKNLWFAATIAVALSFLQVGCVHKVTFQTIDATNNKPLSGVNVEWAKIRYHFFLNIEVKDEMLPSTGSDGIVKVIGVKKNHSFRFYRDGYQNANAVVLPRKTIGIISPSTETVGSINYEGKGDGVIKVKMYPVK